MAINTIILMFKLLPIVFPHLFINLITPYLDIIRRIYAYLDLVVFIIEDSDFNVITDLN